MFDHPILHALGQSEHQHAGRPSSARRFVRTGPWLLNRAQAGLLARARIPGLGLRHRCAALLGPLLGQSDAGLLALAAPAIQLKDDMTRIRAFYPLAQSRSAGGACVKVVTATGALGARTVQETALRRQLEDAGTITLPRIRDTGTLGDFIYVYEELVCGRRFSLRRDAGLFIAQGLPQLLGTYTAFGVEAAPLRAQFPATLREDMAQLAARDAAFVPLSRALDAAWRDDPATPVGLCHGDMLPSNLAVAGDTLYFFDWEQSRRGALVSDLLRLPMKTPQASTRLVAAMFDGVRRNLGVSPAALRHHLCAYMCLRITQRPGQGRSVARTWPAWRDLA